MVIIMEFNDNFDSNLVEILEKIVYDSDLVKELERAENTEDIYKTCQKLGYNQDIDEFEREVLEIINYVQEISDEDLERASGGKNNLHKTCALLLTAINVGAPMTGATGISKNHVSAPKTKNKVNLNKTDSNFKEKFGVFADKTNNYIRRGFKQIGEFAKSNPKKTVGISVASIASVPLFVTIANKISSCIENSRNANEAREQQIRALFSELTEIFNNIRNHTEQYYEKFESDSKLQIIQSNGYVFAFVVNAKNAGFDISADIFNLKNSEILSFTNIINKLKNSTKDKNLLSVIDKLLIEKAEDVQNISIESKWIAQNAKLVKKDEEKKRQQEQAKKEIEEFIKKADSNFEDFLKEYDEKYNKLEVILTGVPNWDEKLKKTKEEAEEARKQAQLTEQEKKKQTDKAKKEIEEFIQKVTDNFEDFLNEYDKKYTKWKAILGTESNWDEKLKKAKETAEKNKEAADEQRILEEEEQEKLQKQCKNALKSLKKVYSENKLEKYNPGEYWGYGKNKRVVAANKFLIYLVDGVLNNSKLQDTKSEDYNDIADKYLTNYMTHAMIKRDLSKIFDANIILEKLIYKKDHKLSESTIGNSPFLKDILKIGYLAQKIYPEKLKGTFGKFVASKDEELSDQGKKYNKIYAQAKTEVEELLEQKNN